MVRKYVGNTLASCLVQDAVIAHHGAQVQPPPTCSKILEVATMGYCGWSRNYVASQGNEVVANKGSLLNT